MMTSSSILRQTYGIPVQAHNLFQRALTLTTLYMVNKNLLPEEPFVILHYKTVFTKIKL